jgi:hypothetical protein
MRRIISIILAISFVVVLITGIHMSVMPKPQNVYHNNPGVDKSLVKASGSFYPKKAHEWSGYLFIGAGLVHIVLNKRTMLSYLKIKKAV